jgi:flagellar biosynthesis/type III secretory pathway M-ring protein FliF/YscJ
MCELWTCYQIPDPNPSPVLPTNSSRIIAIVTAVFLGLLLIIFLWKSLKKITRRRQLAENAENAERTPIIRNQNFIRNPNFIQDARQEEEEEIELSCLNK